MKGINMSNISKHLLNSKLRERNGAIYGKDR